MWCIITGDVRMGFGVVGPFETRSAAEDYIQYDLTLINPIVRFLNGPDYS